MNYSPSVLDSRSIRLTGAVYTPRRVAKAVLDFGMSKVVKERISILEPSVGDGAFLAHLPSYRSRVDTITAVDIDEEIIDELRFLDVGAAGDLTLLAEDFVSYAIGHRKGCERTFDLVVGNPPFIRKHNFSAEIKDQLSNFADVFEYPEQDLKNTWAVFVIAASKMVTDNGVMAFVLPYEILTVSYGQKLLSNVLADFERVDIFVSEEKAFREIDQDAVVLVAQKKTTEVGGFFLSKLPNFNSISTKQARSVDVSGEKLNGVDLNGFLLSVEAISFLKKVRHATPMISEYASSAPGIVTAANDFFIQTKENAERIGVLSYGKRILKKGNFTTKSPVFSKSDFRKLALKEPCYFIHLQGPRDHFCSRVEAYLKSGEALEIHQRYKCRHRENWYEVPMVKSEQGFFLKRSHSYPRILVNEADALTTDSAYGLRLKGDATIRSLCFSFYNSLTMLFAELDGRFYGGGVLELSPTEFRGLPLCYFEPTEAQFSDFIAVHEAANGDVESILDFGDKWLLDASGFTRAQVDLLRNSWRTIRGHRLRHGRLGASNPGPKQCK